MNVGDRFSMESINLVNPKYALVPAVLICHICGESIAKGEKYEAVRVIEKRIISDQWAHTACCEGLAGKP